MLLLMFTVCAVIAYGQASQSTYCVSAPPKAGDASLMLNSGISVVPDDEIAVTEFLTEEETGSSTARYKRQTKALNTYKTMEDLVVDQSCTDVRFSNILGFMNPQIPQDCRPNIYDQSQSNMINTVAGLRSCHISIKAKSVVNFFIPYFIKDVSSISEGNEIIFMASMIEFFKRYEKIDYLPFYRLKELSGICEGYVLIVQTKNVNATNLEWSDAYGLMTEVIPSGTRMTFKQGYNLKTLNVSSDLKGESMVFCGQKDLDTPRTLIITLGRLMNITTYPGMKNIVSDLRSLYEEWFFKYKGDDSVYIQAPDITGGFKNVEIFENDLIAHDHDMVKPCLDAEARESGLNRNGNSYVDRITKTGMVDKKIFHSSVKTKTAKLPPYHNALTVDILNKPKRHKRDIDFSVYGEPHIGEIDYRERTLLTFGKFKFVHTRNKRAFCLIVCFGVGKIGGGGMSSADKAWVKSGFKNVENKMNDVVDKFNHNNEILKQEIGQDRKSINMVKRQLVETERNNWIERKNLARNTIAISNTQNRIIAMLDNIMAEILMNHVNLNLMNRQQAVDKQIAIRELNTSYIVEQTPGCFSWTMDSPPKLQIPDDIVAENFTFEPNYINETLPPLIHVGHVGTLISEGPMSDSYSSTLEIVVWITFSLVIGNGLALIGMGCYLRMKFK